MPEYGDSDYWEKRYQDTKAKTFDWLQDYQSLKSTIEQVCTKTSKILMLGCGNALLSEDMYKDGYCNIYNIDISETVIQTMAERNKEMIAMTYEVMDCTDLKYATGFFDAVIDKSTIDALLCGQDPDLTVARMTKEVQRVLKPSGVYCIISYGNPESRLFHLKLPHLVFELQTLEMTKPEKDSKNVSTHYIYLCKKLSPADNVCKENWPKVEEQLALGEDITKSSAAKTTAIVNSDLEALAPSKYTYIYGDEDNQLSLSDCDDTFMGRMNLGSVEDLNDEETGKYLKDMKEEIERVGKVIV